MQNRPGCLSGILKLTLLTWLFEWLENRFGFGRGVSCTGCGCGLIILIIFIAIACNIIFGTNWFHVMQSLPLLPI
jgi:hypothetical protein